MGKPSRDKGKRGEREAAKALESLGIGIQAERGVQYAGGRDSPDVKSSLFGVHIEVKRTEALSIYKAVEQAIEDGGDKVPLVLHRRNNKEWLAIVPLEHLPELSTQVFLHLTDGN